MIYTKMNGIWKVLGGWQPTLSFNANGGSGTMPVYRGFGKFIVPDLGFTRSGFTFKSWNTAPDGSGREYQSGQEVELTKDTILYAQWLQLFTLTYKHSDKTDNSSWVGGEDETGHMECYALYINGVEQPDLGKFNSASNPTTYTLPYGTTIRVVVSCFNPLEATYDDTDCTVYLNGAVASSGYRRTEYTFTLTSNTTVDFQWKVAGSLVTLNAKSWEDCVITTY